MKTYENAPKKILIKNNLILFQVLPAKRPEQIAAVIGVFSLGAMMPNHLNIRPSDAKLYTFHFF
jgi:hypothetical protein